MKCLICGNENFVCIHKGTRDVPNINVMKCAECNMVQLDCSEYNTEEDYGDGEMLKNTYAATGDTVGDGIDRNAGSIYADVDIVSAEDSLAEVDAVVVTAITFFDEIEESLSAKIGCPILSLEDVLYEV